MQPLISRRRFFGLMAAPAIIGISGKMQLWVPATPRFDPRLATVTPFLGDFSTENLRYVARERFLTSYKYDWRAVYGTPGG